MEDLKTTFNPNDWVESSPDVFIESENSILKFAEDSIFNSIDGEKHYVLCKTAFLLGGYVGGNIISENDARNCLKDAISRKSGVNNLNSAFVTIDKCLDSGKKKPITEYVSNSNSKDHFRYFDYSNFSESKIPKQFSEQEGLPDFPIDVFPESIQKLIITANDTVKFPVNFMGASILFAVSGIVGNAFKIEVRSTQHETALLYMGLVGSPGVNKSHPLKFALKPLYEIEEQLYEEFALAKSSFDQELENYNNLKPKERVSDSKPVEPVKSEIIVSDITLEAMVDVHSVNPKGLCMYRDELRGIFNDLNKYRKGSDLQFLLSNWNSFAIKSNRKSDSNSYYIKSPYIPIIGTIQNEILIEAFKGEMMKNGLIDRFLFVFPESEEKPYYSNGQLPESIIEPYRKAMQTLFELRNTHSDTICRFSGEAFEVFKAWYNENADLMNSEKSEIMKSLYSKLETYVSRFALILELLSFSLGETDNFTIRLSSMEGAIRLAEYFKKTAIYVRNLVNKPDGDISKLAMAKHLLTKGMSLRQIGDMMKLSHTQVGKLLKKP